MIQGGVALRNVPPDLMRRLVDVIDAFKLDFDDAYQYVVAERTQATIVSFDKDFDRTSLGRKSPERV